MSRWPIVFRSNWTVLLMWYKVSLFLCVLNSITLVHGVHNLYHVWNDRNLSMFLVLTGCRSILRVPNFQHHSVVKWCILLLCRCHSDCLLSIYHHHYISNKNGEYTPQQKYSSSGTVIRYNYVVSFVKVHAL